VLAFFKGTSARNCGTHWLGGPDFAVQILSPGDRTPDKFPFYASVKVRELLVIDRDPWSLELCRLRGGQLVSVGKIDVGGGSSSALASEVMPLSFRLAAGSLRPIIEVRHRDTAQTWPV
jgi:hypothetical protein